MSGVLSQRPDAHPVPPLPGWAPECGISPTAGWARLKETAKPSPHFRANPIAVA